MRRLISRAALGAVGAALVLAQPARAETGCWSQEAAAAAKVRDLQSRLMVATLRCRAMGYDKAASYDGFVTANRSTLAAASEVIKARFDDAYGPDGAAYYDRFATALANRYGADATSGEICDRTEAAAGQGAAAGGDVGKLLALADSLGPPPDLPEGECPIVFSAR